MTPFRTREPNEKATHNGAGAGNTAGVGGLFYAALVVLMALLVATPARGADVMKGAQLYAMHCAACHGPRGVSMMPNAPHLARGERLMQSDFTLLATLKAGKNAMPAYLGILSDREILDVIAYSRTLRQ